MLTSKPYKAHLFVCINDRVDGRKSCRGIALVEELRSAVKERGWQREVRVTKTHCMDLCQQGPNVFVSPLNKCFHEVTTEDLIQILTLLEGIVDTA